MAASKITKSNLNIGAISETLKCSQSDMTQISSRNTFDLGRLCTHDNINKWAKYKPIHHSGLQELTDDDRKDRISDGEFYGIICRQTNMNLGSLNNATFEYNRPKGGSSSPYRISDFVNYNHKAKPNVMGKMDWSTKYGEGYFDLDGNQNVYCQFTVHTPDETEIDFSEIYANKEISIKDMYPIFMFGTSDTNMWVTAMRRIDTFQPAKLSEVIDSNGIPTMGFFASFNSYFPPSYIIDNTLSNTDGVSSSVIQDTKPNNFPTNTTKMEIPIIASIGLVTSIVSKGLFDLTYWNEMSDNVLDNFALGVPADPSFQNYGLCGMNVILKAKNADKYLDIHVNVQSLSINITLDRFFETYSDFKDNYVQPDDKQISITVYASIDNEAGTVVVKTVELKNNEDTGETIFKYYASSLFKWNEFGIEGGLQSGQNVSLRITIRGTYDGKSEIINEKLGNYTI